MPSLQTVPSGLPEQGPPLPVDDEVAPPAPPLDDELAPSVDDELALPAPSVDDEVAPPAPPADEAELEDKDVDVSVGEPHPSGWTSSPRNSTPMSEDRFMGPSRSSTLIVMTARSEKQKSSCPEAPRLAYTVLHVASRHLAAERRAA